jgi:aspartate/methionine/tyrosine aminotransferase
MATNIRVWVDGDRVEPEGPAISALDHAVTVGDAVFETAKIVDGAPFALTRHHRRLLHSAAGLGLPVPDLALVDKGVAAVLEGEADVERMLAEYDRRRRLIVDGLNALGLDTFEPRGAFYAFPRISSTGLDDETFAERLLTEERVAVVPGSAFGPSGAGHVRMCYATSYERLEEALRRIGRFVAHVREGTAAAV